MKNKMPDIIFAHILGGYEDHGFGGCAWGSGNKYFDKYMPIVNDDQGSLYYSAEKVKELLDMNRYDALQEIGF